MLCKVQAGQTLQARMTSEHITITTAVSKHHKMHMTTKWHTGSSIITLNRLNSCKIDVLITFTVKQMLEHLQMCNFLSKQG